MKVNICIEIGYLQRICEKLIGFTKSFGKVIWILLFETGFP